ncbi:MAG: CaiB/BaiF CoA-transferase family protein [Acidimicrobiia bacterium]
MRPLQGLRVVELAGLGPVPFAAMWLSDMGADVVRIDRPTRLANDLAGVEPAFVRRGRRSVNIDLKHPDGTAVALDLVASADVVLEGFRPGVMERLGLGPDVCLERQPDLVYGRMTGWGQSGPWSSMAGHDIDYLALSGMLHSIGPAERPVPPLNLVADYGGGAMMLIAGVLAAVTAVRSGRGGCIVDAAMVEGASYLGSVPYALMGEGWWRPERESNLLDGGAPFYRTYETSDGEHMAVGALEPQFYADFIAGLGLTDADLPDQQSVPDWPHLTETFAAVFATRTRAQWAEIFAGSDACVAPVLSMAEAPSHPHNVARAAFVTSEGANHPAPTPRFSTNKAEAANGDAPVDGSGDQTDAVLGEVGYGVDRVVSLRAAGVVG